ncbi:MAG TPA: hypothetical protein VLE73_00740 [Candidatus Saccharimonadales bacterium]|nr:hypothetical protein [Candidatus Saccharimonadales bacterium]
MSTAATKQDITELRKELQKSNAELRKEIKESFADVTSLLQVFMQQVDERFNRVEAEQQKIRADISRIFDYLDSMLKKQEISDDERLVMGHQLDRLDKWIHELAAKIDYKLE